MLSHPPPTPPHPLSDGAVGEAGMFVSLHSELEHLKAEGSVDLFQRVRVCREQCPAFLKNEVWPDG